MRKCANSSPYMRRPLVIYDFATDPASEFPYNMRKILFSFSSVQVVTGRNIGNIGICRVSVHAVCRIRNVGIILRLYRAELPLLVFAMSKASICMISNDGFVSFQDSMGIGNDEICERRLPLQLVRRATHPAIPTFFWKICSFNRLNWWVLLNWPLNSCNQLFLFCKVYIKKYPKKCL